MHGLASLTFITIILNIILLNFIDSGSFDIKLFWVLVPVFCFLIFNLRVFKFPRLFLGDNGSNLLGFILAFLVICSSQNELNQGTQQAVPEPAWPLGKEVDEITLLGCV